MFGVQGAVSRRWCPVQRPRDGVVSTTKWAEPRGMAIEVNEAIVSRVCGENGRKTVVTMPVL